MTKIRYITDAEGKKVSAIVPIDEWKLLKAAYRKIRDRDTNDEYETPPKVGKGKKALYVVQESPIHGRGVFAVKQIRKGTAVIEYKGQHISQDEANERYAEDDNGHHHTVLFTIDDDTVIDARRKGNAAKYINHSCDPNCEAVQYGDRIFIEALRNIAKGEELAYDYHLQVDKPHTKKKLQQYVCHCGSENCRGTQVDLES
jgi:SET domain-containing protein